MVMWDVSSGWQDTDPLLLESRDNVAASDPLNPQRCVWLPS